MADAKEVPLWVQQCEAAEDLEERFGTMTALDYLVGEKFINYLGYAGKGAEGQAEVRAFAERIKVLFDQEELEAWFRKERATRATRATANANDPVAYDDPEFDLEEEADFLEGGLRRMYLVEDAEKWLVGWKSVS